MNTEPRSLVTYRGGAAQPWHRLSGKGRALSDCAASAGTAIRAAGGEEE